jgi:hypothetical protein
VQVGGDTQEQFITWAATKLLPALRACGARKPGFVP